MTDSKSTFYRLGLIGKIATGKSGPASQRQWMILDDDNGEKPRHPSEYDYKFDRITDIKDNSELKNKKYLWICTCKDFSTCNCLEGFEILKSWIWNQEKETWK